MYWKNCKVQKLWQNFLSLVLLENLQSPKLTVNFSKSRLLEKLQSPKMLVKFSKSHVLEKLQSPKVMLKFSKSLEFRSSMFSNLMLLIYRYWSYLIRENNFFALFWILFALFALCRVVIPNDVVFTHEVNFHPIREPEKISVRVVELATGSLSLSLRSYLILQRPRG